MNVSTLIDELVGHGVELWLEGGQLRCRGPEEEVIPRLYEALRQRKHEVAAYLRAQCDTEALRPLSYNQQALWVAHRLAPESAAYNVYAAMQVTPMLDRAALDRAVQRLVDRHEALRTEYRVSAGHAGQRVRPLVDVRVARIVAADAAERSALIRAEADTPFDLSAALIRFALITLAADTTDAVLVLCVHHIAADFASLQILIAELAALYDAARQDRPALLPALPATYLDYVEHEAQLLEGARGNALWEYWRDALAGALPALDLPLDHSRPPVQHPEGFSREYALDADLGAAVRRLARGAGVTPFIILLAAFHRFLQSHAAQNELLIALPTSERDPRFAHTVGDFVNPIALRSDLSSDPSFAQLLDRLRATVAEGIQHREFPFSLLVERLLRDRDLARAPICQAMFNWNRVNIGVEVDSAGALHNALVRNLLEGSSTGVSGATHDIALTVTDTGSGFRCRWTANADLFDPSTVKRFARRFESIVRRAIEQPDRRLSEIDVLPDAERGEILGLRRIGMKPVAAGGVPALITAQARRTPDRTAVTDDDGTLTYAELERRSDELAARLRERRLAADDRVAILMRRSLNLPVALLGVWKAGAAYVPLEPAYPAARLLAILDDARPALILADLDMPAALTRSNVPVLRVDHGIETAPAAPLTNAEPCAGHLAYLIYTSGSTGRPKGVAVEHGSVVNFLEAMREALTLEGNERFLASTTISFDISILELMLPLCCGGQTVVARSELALDPGALLDFIRRHAVDVVQQTPTGWRHLLAAGWRDPLPIRMLAGGEALPRDLAAALQPLGRELWNLYGPTEATVWASARRIAHDAGEHSNATGVETIGPAIRNAAFHVLDELGRLVPFGVRGELGIAGHVLARGYWKQPELTPARFISDPFTDDPTARLYRTGDVVRLLENGELDFIGRSDDQIKLRGFRIELGDIAATLRRHESIADAVAVVRDDSAAPRLVAYVVAQSGHAVDERALRDFMSLELPYYMVPAFVVQIKRIPRLPSGKIDRRALPAPSLGKDLAAQYRAPANSIEARLAEYWAEALKIDPARIGTQDNFFDLGGYSLLLTVIHAKLVKEGWPDLTLVDLYRFPTISSLAQFMERGASSDTSTQTRERARRRREAEPTARRRARE